MQLAFAQGSIEGWIVHFPIGLNLGQRFHGIAIEEHGLIKFSFFIEWNNPNLDARVLTAYSGEIFNRGNNETLLALDWLQVSEGLTKVGNHSYKGREVLRGLAEKDSIGEAHRLAFREMFEPNR